MAINDTIFAIDPGPVDSAWVRYRYGIPQNFGKCDNDALLGMIGREDATPVIEMIASYGMPVGAEVFETCVWIGRFIQASRHPVTRLFRKDVKMHLCGNNRAKDANIRAAIIDQYGGKSAAIGRKKTPGPLYGISKDVWAALALAITAQYQDIK